MKEWLPLPYCIEKILATTASFIIFDKTKINEIKGFHWHGGLRNYHSHISSFILIT